MQIWQSQPTQWMSSFGSPTLGRNGRPSCPCCAHSLAGGCPGGKESWLGRLTNPRRDTSGDSANCSQLKPMFLLDERSKQLTSLATSPVHKPGHVIALFFLLIFWKFSFKTFKSKSRSRGCRKMKSMIEDKHGRLTRNRVEHNETERKIWENTIALKDGKPSEKGYQKSAQKWSS